MKDGRLDLLYGERLTAEVFDQIEPGAVFASGLAVDSPQSMNLSRSGRPLRFVATKGFANDWALYAHFADHSEDYVRDHGDKVFGRANVEAALGKLPDEVWERYRP